MKFNGFEWLIFIEKNRNHMIKYHNEFISAVSDRQSRSPAESGREMIQCPLEIQRVLVHIDGAIY